MRVAQKLKVIDSARNVFFFTEYGKIICDLQKRGGGQRGVSGPGLIKWKFFPNTP